MFANLKILRNERGLSQQRLADALGISQQSVNKYENQNVQPDIDILMRMADYFETSIDYIVGYTDIRRKIEHTESHHLNADEVKVLARYRALDGDERKCIQMMLDMFAKKK